MSKVEKQIQEAQVWRKKHGGEPLDFAPLDASLKGWEASLAQVQAAKDKVKAAKDAVVLAKKAVALALKAAKASRKPAVKAPKAKKGNSALPS